MLRQAGGDLVPPDDRAESGPGTTSTISELRRDMK